LTEGFVLVWGFCPGKFLSGAFCPSPMMQVPATTSNALMCAVENSSLTFRPSFSRLVGARVTYFCINCGEKYRRGKEGRGWAMGFSGIILAIHYGYASACGIHPI